MTSGALHLCEICRLYSSDQTRAARGEREWNPMLFFWRRSIISDDSIAPAAADFPSDSNQNAEKEKLATV
jgi:hypothetical protein